MSIQITVHGATEAEFLENLKPFAALFGKPMPTAVVAETATEAAIVERLTATEPKKPRARKAEAQPEQPAPAAETKVEAPAAEAAAPAVDIEAVRAALKKLGATEGFGHDKVFEVLGKYDAKNASTVPEARRAELVLEIETMLAGAAS